MKVSVTPMYTESSLPMMASPNTVKSPTIRTFESNRAFPSNKWKRSKGLCVPIPTYPESFTINWVPFSSLNTAKSLSPCWSTCIPGPDPSLDIRSLSVNRMVSSDMIVRILPITFKSPWIFKFDITSTLLMKKASPETDKLDCNNISFFTKNAPEVKASIVISERSDILPTT